jgi:nucleotide-binding universal stress UspA family protein
MAAADPPAGLPAYKSIVVGTDGSPTAQEAVRHAVAMSRALGATLHLVSAAPGKSSAALKRESAGAPEDVAYSINPHEDLDAMLNEIADAVRPYGVNVVTHAEIDVAPAAALLSVADTTNADLIVVGNRGMSGLGRLLGSVPNAVSHNAKCNVAIIRTT